MTGATGFLGQHLVRGLLAAGQQVIATGRNLKIGMALQAEGADFRPVDLTDRPGLLAAMKGAAAVVHAGALSSAWGKPRDFHASNVEGTENVIAAAIANGVRRLVYVSSPSVSTRQTDQWNQTEADPLPDEHVSLYSHTKRLGEDRVNAAAGRIETVILRPKAIYGPGDTAIFPRLIKAAARGRLPQIGDGNTITNLTHVSDVVQAILLALTSDAAVGHTYVITGGEDVRIWDVIREVVTRSGFEAPKRHWSLRRAMRIARILERVWKLYRLPGEPPLTTYTAGILGLSQTYDISAARRDLGYEPKITVRQGIEETYRANTAPPAPRAAEERVAPEPLPVPVTILSAGKAWARGWYIYPRNASLRWNALPAIFALIEHPVHGPVLWDTGYAPRYYDATRRLPWRALRWLVPTDIHESDSAVAQLEKLGFAPSDVKWIILSHFDPDHFGGLKDFPEARIACSWRAWEDARGRTGLAALRRLLLPGHLPEDMAGRLRLLPDPDGPPISVFSSSLDFFGDGAIRLVELPGHAAGQLGAFVRRQSDGADLFLVADAVWNLAAIEAVGYRGGAHRWTAANRSEHDKTYGRLRRLRGAWPDLRIVPAHCPRTWQELGEPRETLN
ncbi:MAG: NAD-dependent epimerase/dehydratase family protein [Bauldia sp.]|nr:NAD-dependent epimerase/dehydratase family protein [Bauldia sp.]